ncbi:MAG: YifB family Mg chelatase-like AAA ATPase [Clostridia bacterium]|nr:YifB family Mg chelatase-like AAA ATPase [Clostridia bacterium]
MLSVINSLGIAGIQGYRVFVECDLASGLPNFDVVGLPDAVVKESRGRVRSAVKNSGFDFPLRRITVNLAPADLKKEGSLYDLPILLGILSASEQISCPDGKSAFLGELSLDGKLRPVNGVLPMAISAVRAGFDKIFVPEANANEATLAKGIEVYPVRDVAQLIAHLKGEELISPAPIWTPSPSSDFTLDFADVKGQENAKRALEIAATGGHNILMLGPPGSGKSMLARRIPSILPDMTYEESIETTEIHSVCGLTSQENPFIYERPFRSPHHTVSTVALAGGGVPLHPGEISVAHNGVLFLDELPEFSRDALESMRQPLEDMEITVSRAAGSFTFPASVMFVGAMNPCKCGWHGHPSGRCTCSQSEIDRYMHRISGPLLDRIDMHIEVPSVDYDELSAVKRGEPSSEIRRRVNRGREIQRKRFEGTGITCNANMTAAMLGTYCVLDKAADTLLRNAFEKFGMTARSHAKVLRLARTIADMAGSENIQAIHISEALQYRTLDRNQL